jgi:hypothetical protein
MRVMYNQEEMYILEHPVIKIEDGVIYDNDLMIKGKILCYPTFRPKTEEKLEPIEMDIINCINITGPSVENSLFYDKLFRVIDNKESKIKAIRINYNDKEAGYFIPSQNIVIATDWIHNKERTAEARQIIIPELLKLGFEPCRFKFKITIGADPEFEIYLNSKIVNASSIGFYYDHGKIGVDGSGCQLEIRPSPSDNPDQVIENIKNLLTIFVEKCRLKVGVAGNRYPLGCHIHFGGMKATRDFISVLDYYLGEKLIETSGRARGDYKFLGAWRLQYWGFEYRTLPSSILFDPKVAIAVFKVAKRLAEAYYNEDGVELPPTHSEYERLGITREMEIIDEFAKKWHNIKNKIILKNWGIELKPQISVKFCDEWNEEIKNLFINYFKEHKTKKDILIILFGLASSRGNVVSGFKSKYFETIDFHYKSEIPAFGIPYIIRKEIDCNNEENRVIIKNLVKEIVNEIFKKGGK